MNIKSKLVLYFAILIFIVFSISSLITGVVLRFTLNRFLYDNVVILNNSVVEYFNDHDIIDYQPVVDYIKDISGVEIIILAAENVVASSFETEIPNLDQGFIASEKYKVWRLRSEERAYYYTINTLEKNGYDIYVLRSESIVVNIPDNIYFTSLLGILFFVVGISSVIFYASQSFVTPIRILRDYANLISPEEPKQKTPVFSIQEFSELADSLESAWERLNKYRDYQREFLHNFSHEMKTPLTNIYGYTEGIKYNILNEEEKQKGLDIILKETERVKTNIDQILLMGRIESDEYIFRPSKINLNNILGDALNSVQLEASSKNINLIFVDDHDYYIQGEEDRLEIAFINILSNGIRYANSFLRISVDISNDYYIVNIEDDGIGVENQNKEKIFERFFIGEKGHTGLGLTISKAIIEKHHGKILVEDRVPNGAKFVIMLQKSKN